MDLNKKISFKCAVNEIPEPEDGKPEDNDVVDMAEFWKCVEMGIVKGFSWSPPSKI